MLKLHIFIFTELFHTERSHVRNLRVIEHIFLQRIVASKTLKQDEINLVFSNVSDVLDIHRDFNNLMKNKRKELPLVGEVGDILMHMVSCIENITI